MSNSPRRRFMKIYDVFKFGKYQGQDLTKIIDIDPGYIKWLAENNVVEFDQDVIEELQARGIL